MVLCLITLVAWRVSRPPTGKVSRGKNADTRAGGLNEKRVRFQSDPSPPASPISSQQSTMTTRRHRRKGKRPLVTEVPASPRTAKAKHAASTPTPGVMPATTWAQESLRLVKDHLTPTTQRLYDSHWKWWEAEEAGRAPIRGSLRSRRGSPAP